MSQDKCSHFIDMEKRLAADQYDLFVMKMVRKIGPCKRATIKGNHIWGESFLTVSFADKADEIWKTQQIINTSKHGKRYPQWPSRIIAEHRRKRHGI